jgi:hypothetical protein
MKRASILAAAFLLLGMTSRVWAGTEEFGKGSLFLTPQLGLNSWTFPFGLNAEYGISSAIGVGGTAMFWLWSEEYWSNTLISLSADAAYYFARFGARMLDLYAGGSVGYSFYSWRWKSGYGGWVTGAPGSSGITVEPFLGARCYFTQKIAASLKLYFALLGDWSGLGGLLGVTIRLK